MKTAMTEWFDELKANYPYMANEIFDKGFNKYLDKLKEYQLEFNIPIEVIDMCESQLNVEKEQIKRAFEFGIADAYNFIEDDAEQYYNQTYNQNK
jgi:hypothetical protein